MYFKKMVGERCYLSPMSADDAVFYTTWLNDLQVCRNLTLSGVNITLEGERTALAELAKGHNYAIVDLSTDRLIGNCGLIDLDQTNGTAMVGIFIGDKAHRGMGYGTEAMRLLIDYGFQYLNLHNIALRVLAFNNVAIKCYEKIGFQRIGVRRQALNRERQRHDEIYMDLLAEDFYR